MSSLVDAALGKLGLDDAERTAVSDVLMYAELRGKSQGLIKIIERTVLPAPDRTEMQVDCASACIGRITANGNTGMLVMTQAAEIVANMCQSAGLALLTTCGTRSSTGSIGFYAEKIADQGFIGLVLAGSPKVMALHGSSVPAMGTNPIAVAMPTNDSPLVIDTATAAITWFDVIAKSRNDEELPEGVAVSAAGGPTRSPKEALGGALSAFGGAKGSAIALIFEALTGPLTGASILGDSEDRRGNLLLAIDPDKALGNPGFRQEMSRMLARMRETGAIIPGETSRSRMLHNVESRSLEIDRAILVELESIASGPQV